MPSEKHLGRRNPSRDQELIATSRPVSARVRPPRGLIYLFAMTLAIVPGMANSTLAQTDKTPRKPVLDGDWWQICKMPDLEELNGPVPRRMNVVDHGFVQATNGTWQLWACLRGTAISRLIYGWEGDSLEEGPWKPQGVKVRANTKFGESIRDGKETAGAPFFLKRGDKFLCLFHSGGFRLMESEDGINFTRVQQQRGSSATEIPGGRDVMVLEHHGTYYSYATVTIGKGSYVLASTSKDFRTWSPGVIVSQGGRGGIGPVDAESPFVVFLDGYFYLFRASSISFKTFVYRSVDPLAFGINDDSKLIAEFKIKAPEVIHHDDKWYISDLHDFRGIRMTRLRWDEDNQKRHPFMSSASTSIRSMVTVRRGALTSFTRPLSQIVGSLSVPRPLVFLDEACNEVVGQRDGLDGFIGGPRRPIGEGYTGHNYD